MGRAYEVRKSSIQKTGAIKAKTYSLFSKEIYLAAKGNPDIDANLSLKRMIEKAKIKQVPNDIIERAINKAKGPTTDDYINVLYEVFGPGSSTLIIKCLTDNVNRTLGLVRTAFNKCDAKLGVSNSVSYNYDNLGIISFKSSEGEKVLDTLISANINIIDFEEEEGYLTISVEPHEIHHVKDILENIFSKIEFEVDETGYYAKDKINLIGEDLELFNRLINMLDEIEDVSEVYHNVII